MDQITVRHAEPDDYEGLHSIFRGPQAIANTLQLPFLSVEAWRKRLSDTSVGTYELVACIEGRVVGMLTLWTFPSFWRRRHVGKFAMAVGDEWQGRGVGTALMEAALSLADDWLNLTRIELEVYVDNTAGIALYKKFGFEIEGTYRSWAFRDGEYVDAYHMARIK